MLANPINLESIPGAYIKVGDTIADIQEGLNAGMWTIGLAKTGNELGLSKAEVDALPPGELKIKLDKAYQRLFSAGAHFVVDGIWDIPSVLDEVNARLKRGERP